MDDLYIPRDRDIRVAFVNRNKNFFKKEGNFFVNEYGVSSKVITDLALFDFINNIFYCWEIKSEKDSLKRIEKQLLNYTSFFNVVYVICASKHINELVNFLNNKSYCRNVGIIEVDNSLNFKEIKKATYNKGFFDTFIKNLDFIEVQSLCESFNIKPLGNKNNLISILKQKVSYNDICKSLKKKVHRYFYKKCSICNSTLYYNKTINGQRDSYCFECGNVILN
jgi:hypothetical protein